MSKSKMLIQKHEENLPTGENAYLVGNTWDDKSFKVPDMFDLSKPQKHPKYGVIYFRRIGGCFFYAAYSATKEFARQTKSGFSDYLLYDGGHELITV